VIRQTIIIAVAAGRYILPTPIAQLCEPPAHVTISKYSKQTKPIYGREIAVRMTKINILLVV